MTVTLERSSTRTRRPRVQRSKTLVERFEEHFEFKYPLLGTIAHRDRFINPQHILKVAGWISTHVKTAITPQNMRHILDVCATKHPTWFLNAIFLRMESKIHGLEPGLHLFVETRGFTKIPDPKTPAWVADAYSAAIMDQPNRSFAYLEPLWVTQNEQRIPATLQDFATFHVEQKAVLRSAISAVRRQAIFTRMDDAIESLATAATLSVVLPIQLLCTIFNRIGGVTVRAYEELSYVVTEPVNYLAPIGTANWSANIHRYDPLIVFPVTEFANLFGDEVPLGLVADWE